MTGRPALSSISPSGWLYPPIGAHEVTEGSRDGVVARDELRRVRERRLDLDGGHQLRDVLHDVLAAQDRPGQGHHLGDTAPIACALEHRLRDQGRGLREVQPQPSRESSTGHISRHVDQQLLFFAWRQLHGTIIETVPFDVRDCTGLTWRTRGAGRCGAEETMIPVVKTPVAPARPLYT